MLRIYKERALREEVLDDVLFEGVSYCLDLSPYEPAHCITHFEKAGLTAYLEWHPQNTIAVIRFVNVVGYVRILDRTFDVRSRKLFSSEPGNRQFQLLLEEITRISKGITFDYSGLSFSVRQQDELDLNPSLLERFEYFRQLVLHPSKHEGLETLISLILKNPHSHFFTIHHKKPIYEARRPANRFIRNIRNRDFSVLPAGSDLKETPLAQAISTQAGRDLFLSDIEVEERGKSFDTQENQFVKLLLQDIQGVCLAISQGQQLPDRVKADAHRVQEIVNRVLHSPFFREVGSLRYFPNSSSVLIGRPGYRELYFHYIQSRFGYFNILDGLHREALTTGLKDVATLYEVWVFFKVAVLCLGNQVLVTEQKRLFKDNRVANGFTWVGNGITLQYNATFSRGKGNSYSLNLRPDITLRAGGSLYFFDAKYKVDRYPELPQQASSFKPEDIHKMHCYVDAIDGARASFVVYPGTEFEFFSKMNYTKTTDTADLREMAGVGAIPLRPGTPGSDLERTIQVILSGMPAATAGER